MSMYIVNDDWIREYERNIEELIGSDLEYDSATNPTPPLRKVDGTRWHELFGTPERAANTILALQICPVSKDECEGFCPAHDVCFEFYKDGRTVYEMAEWLRGNA